MFKSIWLLLLIPTTIDGITQIGVINNGAYLAVNIAKILSYTDSCAECICYGFFSNSSFNYQALNCYQNNKTCFLFSHYLSKFLVHIDLNSIFLFKLSQSLQTTIEGKNSVFFVIKC